MTQETEIAGAKSNEVVPSVKPAAATASPVQVAAQPVASFAPDSAVQPKPFWPGRSTTKRWFGWKDGPEWMGQGTYLKHDDDGTTIQLAHGGIIRDRGHHIEVPNRRKADWKTLETAALVAVARYGTVNAQGSEEFVFRAWAVAERLGLPIHPGNEKLFQRYREFFAEGLHKQLDQALGPPSESALTERAQLRVNADAAKAAEANRAEEEYKKRPEYLKAIAAEARMLNAESRALKADRTAVQKSIEGIADVLGLGASQKKNSRTRRAKPTQAAA